MKSWCCFLVFIWCSSLCTALWAQTDEWEQLMQELTDEALGADTDDDAMSALTARMDELEELHEHPLDLNRASLDDMLRLPFIDETQAKAILDCRERLGAFRSTGELRLVAALGQRQLRWLMLCTMVDGDSPSARKFQDNISEHEVLTRIGVPLYKRDGWSRARGISHRLRYTGRVAGRWDFGLWADKDEGEPVFSRQNPLWDAYGAHLMLTSLGPVEKLIVGDFKASMGEGLILNNHFTLGKQLTSFWRSPTAIRPHRSTDEVNYMRGLAATIKITPPISVTALYSWRKFDATVQDDNTVRTINTSGLHRTASEMERHNTLACHTLAAHAAWSGRQLRIGATGMLQHFDHQFRQGTALYRQIYPEGYRFGAAGIDYQLRIGHFFVSGETARSFPLGAKGKTGEAGRAGSGWASLNKIAWRFNPNTCLSAVGRYYSRCYYSAMASAYGENGRVQNESGLALFFDADKVGPLVLHAMADVFYSPWPRYTMTRASRGFELLAQAAYPFNRATKLLVRYSLKSKERSDRRYRTNRLRINLAHKVSKALSVQLAGLATAVAVAAPDQKSVGVALMPRFDYAAFGDRLRSSLACAVFATGLCAHSSYVSAAYDSRLFAYEPSLFQTFGIAQMSGKGEHVAATLKWKLSTRWQLQGKCAVTHYRDRNEISTGPLRIRSPWRTELQLLARWLLR